MNVSNYIFKKADILFQSTLKKPVRIDITQKRFTSVINFCKVYFDDESIQEIIIKYYDDCYKSRLASLRREYDFSIKNQDFINSEEIGVPHYIHFDSDEELVVINHITDCSTLEKTLLKTHKFFKSKAYTKVFYNSGVWLSSFHSININLNGYTICKNGLQNEFKSKWINVFNDKEEIKNNINALIDNVITENRICDISLLHKEYAPGNILHVENKVYGIDFGTPEQGCILDDIAYFIISILVLNKYPKNPFYKRIVINSDEINNFLSGYCNQENINKNIFNTHIFRYFLYKNLIRRISSQLKHADNYPHLIRNFVKLVINRIYHNIRTNIIFNYKQSIYT